jgi:hypothetical protein
MASFDVLTAMRWYGGMGLSEEWWEGLVRPQKKTNQ